METLVDKFGNTSPFPSWVLVDGIWQAPTPHPEDGKKYWWDESTVEWKPYD